MSGQPHRRPLAVSGKSRSPLPEHERVDHQPQLVDQVVLDQGAGELPAAVEDDLAVEPLLELGDLVDHVAGQDRRLVHPGSTSVEDTTYLGMLFNRSAHTPVRCGQRATR